MSAFAKGGVIQQLSTLAALRDSLRDADRAVMDAIQAEAKTALEAGLTRVVVAQALKLTPVGLDKVRNRGK